MNKHGIWWHLLTQMMRCQIGNVFEIFNSSVFWVGSFMGANIVSICWHLTNVKLGRRSKIWFVLSSRKPIRAVLFKCFQIFNHIVFTELGKMFQISSTHAQHANKITLKHDLNWRSSVLLTRAGLGGHSKTGILPISHPEPRVHHKSSNSMRKQTTMMVSVSRAETRNQSSLLYAFYVCLVLSMQTIDVITQLLK